MAGVSIAEAAHRLGISQDTIRKRLRVGELAGERVKASGGFRWLVELPEDVRESGTPEYLDENTGEASGLQGIVATLHAQNQSLQDHLATLQAHVQSQGEELEARRREVQELHVLLQQAQAALPAPKENRHSWWQFWVR